MGWAWGSRPPLTSSARLSPACEPTGDFRPVFHAGASCEPRRMPILPALVVLSSCAGLCLGPSAPERHRVSPSSSSRGARASALGGAYGTVVTGSSGFWTWPDWPVSRTPGHGQPLRVRRELRHDQSRWRETVRRWHRASVRRALFERSRSVTRAGICRDLRRHDLEFGLAYGVRWAKVWRPALRAALSRASGESGREHVWVRWRATGSPPRAADEVGIRAQMGRGRRVLIDGVPGAPSLCRPPLQTGVSTDSNSAASSACAQRWRRVSRAAERRRNAGASCLTRGAACGSGCVPTTTPRR